MKKIYQAEKSLIIGQWGSLLSAFFLGGMVFFFLPYLKQKGKGDTKNLLRPIKITKIATTKPEPEPEPEKLNQEKAPTQAVKIEVRPPLPTPPIPPPPAPPVMKLKLDINLASAVSVPKLQFDNSMNFNEALVFNDIQAPVTDTQSTKVASVVQAPVQNVVSTPAVTITAPQPAKSIYGIGELDEKISVSRKVKPIYPRKARRKNIEGYVNLSFIVDEQGIPSQITVDSAKPEKTFNRAAIRAVKKWRFKPGTVQGKAVKVRVSQAIEFKLR